MKDELLTIQEAAKLLDLSPTTLRRWEEKGFLHPQRTMGNQRRYSKNELLQMFATVESPVETALLSAAPVQPMPITPLQTANPSQLNHEAVATSASMHSQPVTPTQSFMEHRQIKAHPALLRTLTGGILSGILVLFFFAGASMFVLNIGHSDDKIHRTVAEKRDSVLAASDSLPVYQFQVNVPSIFSKKVTFLDAFEIKNRLSVDKESNLFGGINTNNSDINAGTGKLTASNVIYDVLAGSNVTITGDPQRPTISASGGVTSVQGVTGALTLLAGSGIGLNGLSINNAGVLSLGGQTGAVTLTGGSGIAVSGTAISNTDAGSAQNIFKTFTIDGNNISAGSNADTFTFAAGSGITLSGDTGSKTLTITSNAAGVLSGLTTDGVLYATSATTATSTDAGTNGYILKSNGPGVAPTWSAPGTVLGLVAFDFITSGTNTSAAMVVGSGASLGFTGTGTINASSLLGSTWAAPGTIGSTTPNTGAFTALTATTLNGLTVTNTGSNTLTIANGKTLSVSNTLTLTGTDGTSFAFPTASGTLVSRTSTDTLTNKTIAAGSNTITGLTNTNLSGSAGITNANLANSSVTVTAGSGLSGGGAVSLGGSVALANAGVTSATAGSGISIDVATGNITITNNGVRSAVAGTGISVDAATGTVTFTNTGVTSLAGTTNQVNVSGATGSVTLSLPQDIHTGASPTFAGLTLSALSANSGLLYTNASGTVAQTAVGSLGQCLVSNAGGSPIWRSCDAANYWQSNAGTLSPSSDTLDLLVGGTATNSAKFAFINNATGTPVASISANNGNNATYLSGAGVLGTTNAQTLTVGSASTGNVVIDAGSGNITLADNTSVTGNGAGLTFSGSGNHDITATPGTLRLGAATLIGAIAGNSQDITGLNNLSAGGAITFSGLADGIIHTSSGVLSSSAVNLASGDVTGTLTIGKGGTGLATTPTNGQLLIGNGTGYALAGLTSGTAISVVNGAGTITLNNTGVTSATAGSGVSLDVSTGDITITNSGVTSALAGTGIGVDVSTGAVTFSNTGVTALTGTANQVNVSGATGAVILSLPQDIHTAASPTFVGLTLSGLTANGGILYTNGTGAIAQTLVGSAGDCLKSNGGSTPTWSSCASGTNYWQSNLGAISPASITNDLLLGGTSTASAKFAFINNAGGTPTASISGTTTNVATYLDGNGNFGTTNAKTLTLGTASTGNVVIAPGGVTALTAIGANLTAAGTINVANLLTAANGFTLSSGNLNLTGTGGTLALSGLSASSISAGSNALTFTSSNFNTTATGINGTAIGATTPATGAFTTLTATGNTTIGTGASSINTIGSTTTPGTLTLHGATTLDNTLTISGNNLTSLGGNLTVSGTTGITASGNGAGITFSGTGNHDITASTGTLRLGDVTLNGVVTTGLTGNNAALYAIAGTGTLAGATTNTSNQCLLSGVSTPIWGSCALGSNYWQQNAGTVSPKDITNDLLLGGTSTASAKFAFINNIGGGTPTASISGSTINNALYITGDGTVATTNSQSLKLGTSTETGNILINGGNVGIGVNNPTARLEVGGTASIAGSLVFRGASVGRIQTTSNTSLILGGSTTGNILINESAVNFTGIGTASSDTTLTVGGTVRIGTTGSSAGLGATDLALESGSLVRWRNNANTNWNGGAITGGNTASDFLDLSAGGAASGIRFFSTTGGTEWARFSAGNLGINTTNPLATLDVRGTTGTTPIASLSGTTANASVIVDNSGVGDLFTASKSGATKFVITNSGNVGIGTANPASKLEVAGSVAVTGGNELAVYSPDQLKSTRIYWDGTNTNLEARGQNLYLGANGGNSIYMSTNVLMGGNTLFGNYTDNGNLTLESTTGSVKGYTLINPSGGSVGIGTSTPLATLDIRGSSGTTPVASVAGVTSKAAFVVDNSGVGDLFTASKSGATKFVITNAGNLQLAPGQTIDTLTSGTLGIGITNATILTLGRSGQAVNLPGYGSANNSVLFADNTANGVLTKVTATSIANQCLLSGATTPTWGSCSLGTNLFQQNGGVISPFSNTLDLLVGGTSTASAKFAFINNNTGTPTASISGTTINVATYLDGNGNLGTTDAKTLTLGTASTGNVALAPGGANALTALANGNVGIGVSNPGYKFAVLGSAGNNILAVTDGAATAGTYINSGASSAVQWGSVSNDGIAFFTNNATPQMALNTNGGTTIGTYANSGTFAAGPANGLAVSGDVGIGIAAPLAKLDIRGSSGTAPVASISGATAQAGLIVDQSGVGDIFSASRSGAARFAITNAGNLVFGGSTADAFSTTLNISDPTANRTITLPNNSGVLTLNTSGSAVGGTSAFVQGGQSWATTATLGTQDANGLNLITNNVARFSIGSTGTVGINASSSQLATLDVRGVSGTLPIASFSGQTSNAGVIFDNSGLGDLFTASKSGASKFTLKNNGDVQINNLTTAGGVLYTNGSGTIAQSAQGTGGECLIANGAAAPTWASCGATGLWNQTSGALYAGNATVDLLVGGTATTSAKFAFTGVAGGTPTASISGTTTNVATSITGEGVLGTTNKQTLQLGSASTGNVSLNPGGSAALTALSNGKVGIGTTSPGNTLSVNALTTVAATAQVAISTGSIGNTGLLIQGVAGQIGNLFRLEDSTGASLVNWSETGRLRNADGTVGTPGYSFNNDTNTGIYRAGADLLGLVTGGVERLRIDDAGNIAIGTTSPLATLDVRGTSGTTPVASVAGVTSKAALVVDNSGVGDLFTASKSGATKFVINNAGYVGIGTTNPGARLHISGDNTTFPNAEFLITNTGSSGRTWGLGDGSIAPNGVFSISDFTSGNSRFAIDASGNVGIGTTSPGAKLTVVGTSLFQATGVDSTTQFQFKDLSNQSVLNVDTFNDRVSIGNFLPGAKLDILTGGMVALNVNQTGSSDLVDLQSNGTTVTAINNLGLVGIGTTNQRATLDVRSLSGTIPSASISGTTAKAALVVDNSGVGDLFTASKSGASKFVITNAGKVGIGTTTPTDQLEVNGAIRLDNQLNFTNAAFGQIQTVVGNAYLDLKTAAGTGAITFTPNTVETLRLASTGLTSLGTTVANPLATLDIRARSGTLSIASVSGSTSRAALTVDNNGVGDLFTASKSGATKFVINNNGYTGIRTNNALNPLYVAGITTDDSVLFSDGPGSNNYLAFGTNRAGGGYNDIASVIGGAFGDLILQRGGGQVGIGTTAPSAIFDVIGGSQLNYVTNPGTYGVNVGGGIAFSQFNNSTLPYVLFNNINTGSGYRFYTTNGTTELLTLEGTGLLDVSGAIEFNIQTTGDTTIGVCKNTTDGTSTATQFRECNGTATDIAEFYPTENGIDSGDIVSASEQTFTYTEEVNDIRTGANINKTKQTTVPVLQKAASNSAQRIVGIVSTNPYQSLGRSMITQGANNPLPIAINGRVPVKIAPSSAAISQGDMIAVSEDQPGKGTKATKAGFIVGRALENWAPGTNINTILVVANTYWYDPGLSLSEAGNMSIDGQPLSTESLQTALDAVKTYADVQVTELQASSSASLSLLSNEQATASGRLDNLETDASTQAIQLASLTNTVASLSARIDSLETLASGSALLGNSNSFTASSAADLGLDKLDVVDATVSGTLSVIGRTTVADLGVTGRVTIGLLGIDGLDQANGAGQAFASINTSSGPLKIQSNGFNGVDFLGGKVTIATNGDIKTTGEITTTKLNIDTPSVAAASLGTSILKQGDTSVIVDTTAVSSKSAIFVTPKTKTTQPLSVTSQAVGTSFKVEVASPATSDIKFNWWIVN